MPTFRIFLAEIEEELRPTSILQKTLFPQIANLIWRLRRLPEAQAYIFDHEAEKTDAPEGEKISTSQLLAHRFSDDPSNGFVQLGRYERAMQNTLMRLLGKYYYLKKHHPTTPYAADEIEAFKAARNAPRRPPPPAIPTDAEMDVPEGTVQRRLQELPLHVPPRNLQEVDVDRCLRRIGALERTQSNPSENSDFDAKTRECLALPPHQIDETNPTRVIDANARDTVGSDHEA